MFFVHAQVMPISKTAHKQGIGLGDFDLKASSCPSFHHARAKNLLVDKFFLKMLSSD